MYLLYNIYIYIHIYYVCVYIYKNVYHIFLEGKGIESLGCLQGGELGGREEWEENFSLYTLWCLWTFESCK